MPLFLLIGAGVMLALAGVLGLAVAAAYAPTLSNALTHEWVLKPAAYVLLRLISFGSMGAGLLLAVAGVVRRERECDNAPRQPATISATTISAGDAQSQEDQSFGTCRCDPSSQ